jgi:hypothetical protein
VAADLARGLFDPAGQVGLEAQAFEIAVLEDLMAAPGVPVLEPEVATAFEVGVDLTSWRRTLSTGLLTGCRAPEVSYFPSRHEVHHRGDQGILPCFAVALAIDTETLGAEVLGEGAAQIPEGVFGAFGGGIAPGGAFSKSAP